MEVIASRLWQSESVVVVSFLKTSRVEQGIDGQFACHLFVLNSISLSTMNRRPSFTETAAR